MPKGAGHAPPVAAWRTFWSGLADVLLPPACAVCRQPHRAGDDGIVCPACLVRLVPVGWPQCLRCGQPRLSAFAPLPTAGPGAQGVAELPPCRWCARLQPAVRAVRSVCRMDSGTGAALVHALKYNGWQAVAPAMARRMARVSWPQDVIDERAALVPVPLAAARERERGYNQAERLADALAPLWTLPVWRDVLCRTRSTNSQVRLTPSERASNVSGAFTAPAHAVAQLRGVHVILVDDVITTAATINAAAQALVDGGARIISCVTFGRAPDPGDRTDSDFDIDFDRI